MKINQLHQLTGEMIANGKGNAPISINLETFYEGDNGENISPVERAEITPVFSRNPDEADIGEVESHLVLSGE